MKSIFYTLVFMISLLFSSALTSPVLGPNNTDISMDTPPFHFRYLFTAYLTFGPLTSETPIIIPGGLRFVVPITGGTVTGPAGNGTISGGTAYGQYYNNQTYQNPKIAIYGQLNGTNATTPFFVQEDGVTTEKAHPSRIYIDTAGDEFRYIREGFVLARRTMSEDGKSLNATCYLVEDA